MTEEIIKKILQCNTELECAKIIFEQYPNGCDLDKLDTRIKEKIASCRKKHKKNQKKMVGIS